MLFMSIMTSTPYYYRMLYHMYTVYFWSYMSASSSTAWTFYITFIGKNNYTFLPIDPVKVDLFYD